MRKINMNTFKKSIYSIKAKVSLLCTLFILIAVIFNYSFISNVSKKAITHNTEAAMQDLASAYSTNLEEIIRKVSSSGNFMMNSDVIASDVNSESELKTTDINELITMYMSSNTSTEEINITNAKGIVMYSSNSKMVGKDLSKEDYFSNMISTGVSTQSNVFLSDVSKEACITFASPLRNMGTPGAGNNTNSTKPSSDQGNKNGFDALNQPVEEFAGAITTVVKASEFSDSLSNITVSSYKTGYSFILDSDGNVIYHPDSKIIGTKLKVKEISNLVKQIKAGNKPSSNVLTYTYKGVKKYAGFNINTSNNWILFVTAEQPEILSQLNKVSSQSFNISIILIVILSILAYLITGLMTKSIAKITGLINKTADLDFSDDTAFTTLSAKKDETGEMSRAIEKMRITMKNMIVNINEISENISNSSNNLMNISYSVNEHATDNSATAEELSASMQETVATTEHINNRIEQISINSKDINEMASFGEQLSTDLMKRAQELKEATSTATEKTNKIYLDVKDKTKDAIEQSKAVSKINGLAQTIRDVAKQTSLLALNASIEAARAGDAGRGFSVVASEIGILADQSARTVSSITEIVSEVHSAVENLTMSLMQTLTFLEKNVIPDYEGFIKNSENYNSDSETMNDTMKSIHNKIDILNHNVLNITDSITEINSMVNEASKGVIDVADKNTNIVALTSNTQSMANENTDYASGLSELINKFKI